jgi:hypothetical protein
MRSAFCLIALLITCSITYAATEEVIVPNTFSNGEVADADAVNANFAALADAINSVSTDNNSASADNTLLLLKILAKLEAHIAHDDNDNDGFTPAQGDCDDADALEHPGEGSNNCGLTIYSIGDKGPAGGAVFYITDGGVHGLEAAYVDQDDGSGVEWGCTGDDVSGAEGTAIGTGAQNTNDILDHTCGIVPSSGGAAYEAAILASNYSLNGFNDWYLPSKDELNELYKQKSVVGGFADFLYWSSSEDRANNALTQYITNGYQSTKNKRDPIKVRAIRTF